jgi:hypothetical protein
MAKWDDLRRALFFVRPRGLVCDFPKAVRVLIKEIRFLKKRVQSLEKR